MVPALRRAVLLPAEFFPPALLMSSSCPSPSLSRRWGPDSSGSAFGIPVVTGDSSGFSLGVPGVAGPSTALFCCCLRVSSVSRFEIVESKRNFPPCLEEGGDVPFLPGGRGRASPSLNRRAQPGPHRQGGAVFVSAWWAVGPVGEAVMVSVGRGGGESSG